MILDILKQLGQCFLWFVIIAPWEQAIRIRMGKNVKLLDAGFWIRIPFIDRIYKQSIRRRLSIIRPQTLTTSDRHVITLAGAVGFAIKDLGKLFDTLESPNDTIENEVAALIAQFVGSQTLEQCSANALEKFVAESLDLTKYGLEGQEFYLTNFATCKTYRFIQGDFATWGKDKQISMNEHGKSE